MTVVKTSLRNFFAHKGRMALSAVAVLLSVAFVCGTLVFTDTMNTTFDKLFAVSSADVTVSPKDAEAEDDPQNGVPESLPASTLETIRSAEGVESAEGAVVSMNVTVVDADNDNVGATSGAPTLAGNWTKNDLRSMEITSGHAPRGPTEAMVDSDTADKHDLKIGDELRTIAQTGDFKAKIVGIASFTVTNPGAAVVYFDTPTAQRQLLGGADRFSQFNVTAASGVTDAQLKQNVTAALDGGSYKVQTAKETSDEGREDVGEFMNVIKYAMLGFAGIAFLVGIFLIINTFSMLVAQRTREIGLMRAIGSSRRQVNRSVLVEALFLGIVGSVLGVAAGVGIAVGLMKLMSAAGMNLSTDDLTIKTATPVVGLVLGIVVTVLAAYLPARRAGKISPMAALRDAGTPADGKAGWIRGLIGLVLTGAGAAALFTAGAADKASEGSMMLGAGIVLTLIGFVVIGPLLAGFVVRVISAVLLRAFGPVGRLAERNALRNPRRTGATGAALMIGLALVACLSVVGSSMVASATSELDKTVGADFIVQGNQRIVPQAEKAMQDTPGLEHVTRYKVLDATLTSPDGKTDDDGVTAADPTYAEDVRRVTTAGELSAAYGTDAMSVGSDYAEKHGVQVGDTISVAFKGGETAKLKVAAITSDDVAIDQGARYISIETMRKYLPAENVPPNMIMFAKAEEGQADQAYAALKKSLDAYPQYQVADQTDYKQELKDQVGQLLNMVYGLLALAIIVAVLGVVNTLALSVVERTREIGLMRAIGLSRRQLRRMIRMESVVIALFGALLGLGLGMGWGATAQKLLALEGLNVLDIPWPTIIGVFIGSAFVGLFAALVPAFRAGRMNVLNAIATE
ncbi:MULTISPECIES: ABC transporter permease [Streptomyces]|uniref:ABC transporter permease n=2 Tax=Streptomyces rochei group TaxID=2867164 RepID=A0ABW7E6F0_STRRO|nr:MULTISPECIES: FtsX-like permease family protein [Streptomyces]MBD2817914.1 FtsX-like permease family protein [Streptomyces parvulus]RIH61349.1 FtsX-like permease family protein [Streptomyces sp. SHP22-7]MBQ0883265.1 FtsX-like permease family protein [Streptomyces sp. RT42]MBU8550182.1 FtsX-like permease family protein [Streptomyces sp. Osf17]MBU8556961.1 FtsX-like permease family protein [Streptomyces sp. Babs14]